MPNIDGMDLAAYIRKYLSEVLIIFITSHLKYAIDAFELSIFRYIPKNSIDSRLPHALKDAINMINIQADMYYTIQMPTRIEKIPYQKIPDHLPDCHISSWRFIPLSVSYYFYKISSIRSLPSGSPSSFPVSGSGSASFPSVFAA